MNKCILCGNELSVEDNRADTDRGTFGDLVFWCEDCDQEFDDQGDFYE